MKRALLILILFSVLTFTAAAADTLEFQLVAVHGTLVAAQADYNNRGQKNADGKQITPFMPDAIVPSFNKAVESFNRANMFRRSYDQAVALHQGVAYTRKQFEKAMDVALEDLAALQKARGIQP